MKDERKILYENYVSEYKNFISDPSKASIKSLYKHYDVKILPRISHFRSDANILELGCGPGDTLVYLRDKGYNKIKGIDISGQQIETALKKNLDVKVQDVFDFFAGTTEKYDLIVAFDFIEHFKKDEIHSLFNGISNHLNYGGIIIIRTPNGQGIFSGGIIYGDLTHYTIFNPASLTQILKLNGFDEICFFENAPVSKNLIGVIRKILWLLIKFGYNFIRMIEQGITEKFITQDFYCVAKKNK